MIKVSIVIPVYNCGQYIQQCINSVCNQTLDELEIICIDDGSTDQSAELIRNLADNDKRIVLFQQENQGPGPARNLGIRKAKGKYIAFLDGDDYYIDADALEKMFCACEEKKVSVCGSQRTCTKYEQEEKRPLFEEEAWGEILQYKDYQMDYFYQNYLFLRQMLIENQLYFPSYRRYQDPPFFIKALYSAERFTVSDTCLYCYRASDVYLKFDSLKTADMLKGVIESLAFAREHKLEKLFYRIAERMEYNFAAVIYNNVTADDLEQMSLLKKANYIIKGSSDCGIRPLEMILYNREAYEIKLLETVEDRSEIAIYGAGMFARLLLGFLRQKDIVKKVSNIVVSELKGNPSAIYEIPVITFQEFLQQKRGCLLVAAGGKNQIEIYRRLEESGYTDYRIIIEQFFLDLQNELS